MITDKDVNETPFEYKQRIFKYKETFNYTWPEIANIINLNLGCDYSPDKYRKEYSRGLGNIAVEESSDLLNLKKERVKLSDERTQINALVRKLAREETFAELARECAAKVNESIKLKEPVKIKESTNKKGVLAIGDWHYGLEVDLFLNKYNPEISKKRVNELMNKVYSLLISENVRDLYVINLGDLISGNIHLPLRINSRLDVVTQTQHVTEILAEFLSGLSQICNIHYYSVLDNHSRVDANKKDSIQTESYARFVDWYLKGRLENNPNITFYENEFGGDIASFEVFNHKFLAVHGDKDPQKNIISNLTSFTKQHYDVIISAHMHHFSANEENETEFFCNGALIGTDDYANSLRLNSKPSQLLLISTPDNPTECIYKLKLSE